MNYRSNILVYFQQRNRGWILSLLVAIMLVYVPFLGNAFFFDDLNFFTGNISHKYANLQSFSDLRWLPYATLGWTAAIFSDLVPHFFHLGNMLLHATNVILLFYLLRQLLTLALPTTKSNAYSDWGAWLGALLFACHPVAVYAVGYVTQRSILMATLFTIAMQLTYLRGLICNQKRWLVLSLIFYSLAVFSKEHSLMAPAILLAFTLLLSPQIRANKLALWSTWFGYLVIAIIVVLRVKGVFGTVYEYDAETLLKQQDIVSTKNLHLLSVLTQTGLFFKYLFLWLVPNPAWMSVDMRENFVNTWASWQNWIGIISFILYGVLALKLLLRKGKAGLVGLALLYPWLFFIVEFSTIRVQEPFVLYRSYLWMPGITILIPLLVDKLPNHKRTVATIMIIAISLIPLSWNRLWVFADSYRLWNDAALLLKDTNIPGAVRIYFNRGKLELDAKNWEKAIADFSRAAAINPKIEQIYVHTGTAYSGLGRYQEAINNFNLAIMLNPDYADAYFGKAIALKHLDLNEDATTNMNKSCSLGNKLACFIVAFFHKN